MEQVHFSKQDDRRSPALRQDLDFILRHAVRLLHATVDVMSSNRWDMLKKVREMDLEEEVETRVNIILSMEDDARSK
ncbi:hypothetical protein PC110_g3530 [Phytophthora cactorum]|uniref:Uncharacterized protein n=1 Tax=Phytophthora cactorum TaxID=29920 RepID=A0A329SUG9_9STRA|nr:hypothetical protein PC110_g3530 [Phytophthora cactorum]